MECIDKKNNLPGFILGRDSVIQTEKSVQIHFAGKRQVLSSSPFNGGYRDDLSCVFNFDEIPECGYNCSMRAPTYEEHMKIIASEIGINPDTSAGLSTAVQMTSAVYRCEEYKGLKAEAIVTGGIEVNGGRAGDTASWDERDFSYDNYDSEEWEHKPGTINIMLAVNAKLSEGAMTKAVITATEAKTAAIQELAAPSCYSEGIATGSGTDGIILICDAESDVYLTDAGQHSKLGELIGKAIIPALKESMYLQTGICRESQHNVCERLKRFGITEEKIKEFFIEKYDAEENEHEKLMTDDENVVKAVLYAHILDEMNWNLLTEEEGRAMLKRIEEMK